MFPQSVRVMWPTLIGYQRRNTTKNYQRYLISLYSPQDHPASHSYHILYGRAPPPPRMMSLIILLTVGGGREELNVQAGIFCIIKHTTCNAPVKVNLSPQVTHMILTRDCLAIQQTLTTTYFLT